MTAATNHAELTPNVVCRDCGAAAVFANGVCRNCGAPAGAFSTGRILDRTADGRALSFTVDSPQRWHDGWRNVDRVMRYYGRCKTCGIRTYAFDDGENDPRGVLGDHANDSLDLAEHLNDGEAAEVTRVGGVLVPACFGCTNDYDRYQALIRIGVRRAIRKGASPREGWTVTV